MSAFLIKILPALIFFAISGIASVLSTRNKGTTKQRKKSPIIEEIMQNIEEDFKINDDKYQEEEDYENDYYYEEEEEEEEYETQTEPQYFKEKVEDDKKSIDFNELLRQREGLKSINKPKTNNILEIQEEKKESIFTKEKLLSDKKKLVVYSEIMQVKF